VTLIFSARGWEDYLHWQANDRKVLERLNELIKQCQRTPFAGIGKPEPLRGKLSGWWSRRPTQEDRLVYRATEQGLIILQCRYHY
jgi:toxin YoeB